GRRGGAAGGRAGSWRGRAARGRPGPGPRRPLPLRDLATTRQGRLVVPQPEERRVPKTTVVSPLREANLGDQRRLDPRVATPARRAAGERRARAPERLQAPPDGVERRVVEAGADATDVDERVAVVE